MGFNKNEKAPTTKSGQDKTCVKGSTDSRNTQAKIVPNKEEKVTEKSLSPYFHNTKGQLMFSDGETEVIASDTYIKLRGFIRDEYGCNWEAQIEFNDLDGKLKTIQIPRSTLTDQKQVKQILADAGYPARCCLKVLHHYLTTEAPRERSVRVHQSGWISNSLDYVCPSFQTVNSDMKYISPSTEHTTPQGNLEEWKKNICCYCEGNHILTLALCVSLSGILLKFKSSINSTMINIIGKSSIGKTTALLVASSIWGDRRFIKQWRTTSNALESVAAEHNDGLLILDELSQVSAKDVSQIFYMLGNEQGKQRMYSDISLRKSKHWKIAILSSGEVGVADKIEEIGIKAKAGQLVRCIDIDALIDTKYGIYNTLHNLESGSSLSNLLKENCEKYHGMVAEEFIKQLTANNTSERLKETIRKDFDIETSRIYDKHDLKVADGQVRRVSDIFTLYATTGVYAAKFGIFTHNENQIRESIDFCFERWLKNRGGKGAYEEQYIVENVSTFLLANAARFDTRQGIGGTPPRDRLGYMDKESGKEAIYYIYPALFKTICNGMNPKTVREALKQRGILETYEDGRAKYVETKDGRQRLLIISFNNQKTLTEKD